MRPRESNSERGWRRLEEEREETEERGILELFHRDREPDEDAPLSRSDDDED
ncbi:MAG: hypothetical protein JO073_10165 [Actinobacteria bacterium]|nr:hypothetical protein [Actinomycetota bacterium]